MHVTLRAVGKLPSLRKQVVFLEARRALARTARAWFRVVHFSVQADHVHLLVEARDKIALSRGLGGLAIRVARAVNQRLGRSGKVWADRYHARALRTPREVRHGIVYVLANWHKHVPAARGLDGCSSAWWLDGWSTPPTCGPPGRPSAQPSAKWQPAKWQLDPSPVQPPETWLARTGWKRHGLLRATERPKPA